MTATISSKILIDSDRTKSSDVLRDFIASKNLIGIKNVTHNIFDLLSLNSLSTDIGGIIISDHTTCDDLTGYDLVNAIHTEYPELPIFYELTDPCLEYEDIAKMCCAVFSEDNLQPLSDAIDKNIFSMYYPPTLIHDIQQVSFDALLSMNPGIDVQCDFAYLVKSNVIFGELFSLIPMECDWYRGFMMLQSSYGALTSIAGKKDSETEEDMDASVNDIINEATNLIWGGIKSKYSVKDQAADAEHARIQIPIIINHKKNYISFGSDQPQLCFKYTISSKDNRFEKFTIFQKMVFSLRWSPDDFDESVHRTENLIESGELELF
ncbi:MAG: hypothetical protein COA42_05680 [Alteromonadaceae bacterium]|nr:MAG: hypothetical protein COA42_05680 [Alteromonadaceae bacterium]